MALPPPAVQSAALITGASSGIGGELAARLAGLGHNVLLVARTESKLEALAAELRERHGVRAEALPCDLTDAAARDDLAARIEALGLDVELLVNNAGVGTYVDFVDAPREQSLNEVRLDVEAVVDLSARYLPGMVERGRGAVINLASSAGLQPLPHNATYSAAKSFVLFHSEAVAWELRGTGVTITAVLPGPVPTEFIERNDASFTKRMPKLVWCSIERVAEDALAAADAGKRTVIPGGPLHKAFFGPNRYAPSALGLPIAERIMRS